MAFSSTISGQTRGGMTKIVWGTYNAASVTTGELDCGITQIDFLTMQPVSGTVIATGNSVDETMPYTQPASGASKTTIDTATSETGMWLAIGNG